MRLMKALLRMTAIALSSTVLMLTAPTFAHHSFGRYEMMKRVTIEGVVARFEWSNPHCWLLVVVPTQNGESVTYGFEMSSVGEMRRRGWAKTSLKTGDHVKVEYRPLRDGSPGGLLMSGYDDAGKLIGNAIRGGAPDGAALSR